MEWFRWHNDTVENKKWRAVARRTGQPVAVVVAVWAALCENANQSPERGTLANWNAEDAAAVLDLDVEVVTAITDAMQGRSLDGDRLTGWETHNPKREDPTAARRKARQRANRSAENVTHGHAASRNVTHVTTRHATEREKEVEVEEESEKETDTTSILILRAGAAQDVEGQITEIVRAANRGMIDNPAIGTAASPIPVGHGSREAVREWLDTAPFEVVKRAVYERARAYVPDGQRARITTMRYFAGAVHDEVERWRASHTTVSDERTGNHRGVAAPARGADAPARKPDRFERLVESA